MKDNLIRIFWFLIMVIYIIMAIYLIIFRFTHTDFTETQLTLYELKNFWWLVILNIIGFAAMLKIFK